MNVHKATRHHVWCCGQCQMQQPVWQRYKLNLKARADERIFYVNEV